MSHPRQCGERARYDFRSLAGKVERAQARLDDLRAEWTAETAIVLERLGLPSWLELPPAAFDILVRIDPTEDGHWIWRGTRNNKGTPTVRLHHLVDGHLQQNEGTAARFVHKVLRGEPNRGAMHPLCDRQDCVLPQHRCRPCREGTHPITDCDALPEFESRPQNWRQAS